MSNTTSYLKEHVRDVQKTGHGTFSARVTIYNNTIVVTFHDSEVYDRIHFDRGNILDTQKGTGGYTLRQALEFIYNIAVERRRAW